jgi:hypothetical protein
MIELEINGARQRIEPRTTGELRDAISRGLPAGHLVSELSVDGRALDEMELDGIELQGSHAVAVRSASPRQLARASLPEATEWIGRICSVLEQIARDYRIGRDAEAARRLVDALDALHVLASLLGGIRRFVDVDPVRRPEFERDWENAEHEFRGGVEQLHERLQGGDPLGLADCTGHRLPHVLRRFGSLLGALA